MRELSTQEKISSQISNLQSQVTGGPDEGPSQALEGTSDRPRSLAKATVSGGWKTSFRDEDWDAVDSDEQSASVNNFASRTTTTASGHTTTAKRPISNLGMSNLNRQCGTSKKAKVEPIRQPPMCECETTSLVSGRKLKEMTATRLQQTSKRPFRIPFKSPLTQVQVEVHPDKSPESSNSHPAINVPPTEVDCGETVAEVDLISLNDSDSDDACPALDFEDIGCPKNDDFVASDEDIIELEQDNPCEGSRNMSASI